MNQPMIQAGPKNTGVRSIAWGAGWAIGLTLVAIAVLLQKTTLAVLAPVAIIAANAAYVLPIFASARWRGSPRAGLEALVWMAGFAIGIAVLWLLLGRTEQLASPGDINSVTAEDIARRRAELSGAQYPAGAIAVFVTVSACVCTCGFTSSWILRSAWPLATRLARAVLVAVAAEVGAVLALMALLFIAPFAERVFSSMTGTIYDVLAPLWASMLAGFVGGVLFGFVFEAAVGVDGNIEVDHVKKP